MDRESQLKRLDEIYRRTGAQFLVLYGRRRIGKTALITHWLETRVQQGFLYWVAHKSSPGMLLEKFSKALQPFLPGVAMGFRFTDWETALQQVFEIARKRRIVVAIDEFQYLLESVPEIASILQIVWDKQAKRSRLFLILAGSHFHMMRSEFLAGRGPLYGRTTADILLEEIDPESIHLFLPSYSPEQVVETYSVVGGVPKYLEMWDDRKPVLSNIREVILSPVTIFRQEAIYLIQDEIAEPRTYLGILEAIGSGMQSPSSISKETAIPINHIGKYLRSLLDLGFVRRIISVDARDRKNTRLSRYEIQDAYLKFHFTYIVPNLELLEQNRLGRLLEIIDGSFSSFVGRTGYEELARRFIIRLGDNRELPFVPDRVGRIWNKHGEIDIAALQGKSRVALFGECRWSNRKITIRALDELKEKVETLSRIKDYKLHYALFSKSGFTKPLMKRAMEERILLFEGARFKRVV
ncbi:MAG: AAA family ATPase [Planctomycetes bacterium]|nr:AAA family ATPase [Planctomycetota bacterium]